MTMMDARIEADSFGLMEPQVPIDETDILHNYGTPSILRPSRDLDEQEEPFRPSLGHTLDPSCLEIPDRSFAGYQAA